MRTESLTDAKNRLSQLVREVRAGARIRILVRGEPVADLVPVGKAVADEEHDQRLLRLERAGLIRRARVPLDPALLTPPAGPPGGRAASELIIEERERGR